MLPVTLVAAVALSVYVPSLFLSTKYNFVYSSCTDNINHYSYQCGRYLQKRYSVAGNRLIVNTADPYQDLNNKGVPDNSENYTVRIFLHDTKKNESREITLEEAQSLTLDGLLTSPDGVVVSGNYNNGGNFFFLFSGGGASYDHYLTKGKVRYKLNLINLDDSYYQSNFKFIGWVLPGRN